MTSWKLALALWTRDTLIGLVASLDWPRWRWASRAVDKLEVLAEGLRERREARE